MSPDPSQRQELLEAYQGLRLADVRDGLDAMMYHHVGSMHPTIRPLWPCRAFGIARTVRYLPYAGSIPYSDPEAYRDWARDYYKNVCPYPWMGRIEDGDFIVIDASGVNAGLMGSENTLGGISKGARGYVSNGGCRDTDEVIKQKVPFWAAMRSQTMVQGRLQLDATDVRVAVGGVTVCPGDIVIADGDGVLAVPRAVAMDVARLAREEHERDKKIRRKHYEALGLEPDETV
jgi:regulator of RNase E activity RraA